MKTIFKVILPVMAFTLASAAAIGTNEIKVEEAKKPVVITGYIQNPTQFNCLPVSVDCTTEVTTQICESSEATPRKVWRMNTGNACNLDLYKVIH